MKAVELTNSNFDGIEAGSTFEITWDDAEGPVTLTLKNGPENDLQTVEAITSGASGGSYVWNVDSNLVSGDYAIEITDGVDVNYSQMFPVAGTDAPSSTASSTGTVTSTSATRSSTSTETPTTTATTTTTSEESTSTETTSTKTSSSESTTSSESSSATTSSESTMTTASSSSVTRTTTSEPSTTESGAPESTVPNSNDAQSVAAPIIPGILALLGAALI
ncbi:hypothetical protein RRF57_005538 [Xylaria bambusicola]|uniref:Extracellular matrix protein n=1 Tax=Xylaria bambusicola TaxID=326684 RepID=A0AAN7UNM8_9PEZI